MPDPRRWYALALLCGAFFMVILDANIVVVALPSIEADLGLSEQGLQWVISAYALTFAGLLLLGGRAADLLGRRRVFMVGLLFFTGASLLCGLAWSPGTLIGARAVQGIGAAIMTPTALSIISTTFEEGPERNKALGIWGLLGAFGATAGYLIAGPLVDGPGWEWIFFINVPRRSDRARALPGVPAREPGNDREAELRPRRCPQHHRRARPARLRARRSPRRRLGQPADGPPVRGRGGPPRDLRGDRVAPSGAAAAAAHPSLAHARRRERRDAALRCRRLRHALHPHALLATGARLFGPRVRRQLRGRPACGRGRDVRRPGRGPEGRLQAGRRDGHGALGRRIAHAHAGVRGRQLLRRHLPRAARLRPRHRSRLRHRLDRRPRRRGRA